MGESTASLAGFDIAAKGALSLSPGHANKCQQRGEKFVGSSYHSVSLFCALGIGEGGNATADIIVKHKEFLAVLRNEDPKLLDQFLNAINVMKAEVEKFFIEHQLEPVRETTSIQQLGPFNLF